MELTLERKDIERDCKYTNLEDCPSLVIREAGNTDYRSAVVLLRNLKEKKDITSLEREALSVAIRFLQHSTGHEIS